MLNDRAEGDLATLRIDRVFHILLGNGEAGRPALAQGEVEAANLLWDLTNAVAGELVVDPSYLVQTGEQLEDRDVRLALFSLVRLGMVDVTDSEDGFRFALSRAHVNYVEVMAHSVAWQRERAFARNFVDVLGTGQMCIGGNLRVEPTIARAMLSPGSLLQLDDLGQTAASGALFTRLQEIAEGEDPTLTSVDMKLAYARLLAEVVFRGDGDHG